MICEVAYCLFGQSAPVASHFWAITKFENTANLLRYSAELFEGHGGKVLLHELVNEPIAPPYSLEQEALSTVVEEASVIPRDTTKHK